MSVAENIAEIRERIEKAAQSVGKKGSDIVLVGASKMTDAAACREAVAAGIDALGENRVQEMRLKISQRAYDGAPLHFIGHLQRNKVRQVVTGEVSLIQSVGSNALLLEIEKAAAGLENFIQPVLLEVNIGEEAAKSGFLPDDLQAGAELALTLRHIEVWGLMAIPPFDATPEENRRYFDRVYALYVDMGRNLFHNNINNININNNINKWDILSMGMSGDFEDAIRAGATMVRVGTSIFGARHYNKS